MSDTKVETYNYIGALCRVSGNPCGTDTHAAGFPCQCDTCRAVNCITTLEQRVAELQAAQTWVSVRLYNAGYAAGHEDTVEARYTHILDCDKDTYHADVVADFLADCAPPAAQSEQPSNEEVV